MKPSPSSNVKVPPAKRRIEFNPVLCSWCRCCELTCSLVHEGVCSPALARIHLSIDQFEARVSADFCQQCEDANCVLACPNDAIFVDGETGARVINEPRCMGCGACAGVCPFNAEETVIVLNPKKNVYVKCDLCLRFGGPQCVAVCPQGALKYVKFGDG